MAFSKSLKLQIYLLFLALLLVGLFIFHFSTNPLARMEKSWIFKSQSDPEYSEMAKVLRNAARMDRTVILTTVNEAWAAPNSIFDLFLESFRIGEGTSDLLRHLVIIAMDQKAFDRCRFIHSHCFSLATKGVDFSGEKRFMTADYLKMMWRRIRFLQSVLELGYHFVFTGADVMWFRNPLPHFTSAADITIACDIFSGNSSDLNNRANGGFYYVRANSFTIQLYKYWYMERKLYPGHHDQDVFNIIKHHQFIYQMGLEIKFLDTAYFGGCYQKSADLNKVCTMHANCCVGIERKLHDLTLVLEDWRNFTALSMEERGLKKASWRAPSKCKWWK
ncbi:uncharacterized protein At4g15970-like isoform X2 [Magnolia sinica]|uniref:uncharacterized protein At4g15970-like isoform X2 n=1 Tax=Magnolia sinica TaxID=86752 RepID=UPI002657C947|nr:uncharacterized protein At4g15970-like isoform X2 [Magnolia sinica]